jgi:hypothetical protein
MAVLAQGLRERTLRGPGLLMLVCLAALLLPAAAARAQPAAPNVTGPLPAVQAGDPSHDYPFDASLVPVSRNGYTEKEYFFSGDTSAGSYTSRMLVRRPADPARFSGTVIVEWARASTWTSCGRTRPPPSCARAMPSSS